MTPRERYDQLSAHRRSHIERVIEVMEALSLAHGLNREDARLAGFGHDLARELSRSRLLDEAQALGIACDKESLAEPILLHGPIAAEWLRRSGMGHHSVHQAIYYHTTAHPQLDDLGKALYIADGVEPGRQYVERESLYQLALTNLQDGYCAVIRQTLTYLQARGISPHPYMRRALTECH